MQKYLLLVAITAVLISCGSEGPSPESKAIEASTLKCWNENWSKDKAYDISKGITLLDDYLFRNGYLGKRTVMDYKNFFNDTALVFIPDTVKGSSDMNAALNSDFSGEPNIEGMIKCWETNWFAKLNTLDTSDVLVRTGKLVEMLSKSGDMEYNTILTTFFTGMSEEEMSRPLIKDVSYFIFWKTRGRKTHIQVTHEEMEMGPVVPQIPPGGSF